MNQCIDYYHMAPSASRITWWGWVGDLSVCSGQWAGGGGGVGGGALAAQPPSRLATQPSSHLATQPATLSPSHLNV